MLALSLPPSLSPSLPTALPAAGVLLPLSLGGHGRLRFCRPLALLMRDSMLSISLIGNVLMREEAKHESF